jgi:hypothetical protein
MTVYRPTPASDRPETAPILPTVVTVRPNGSATATYTDHVDEHYGSLDDLCREHQMSKAELGEPSARWL